MSDSFQFNGFVERRTTTRYVDPLSDEDLRRLNALLPWSCFTVDANGRRFGDIGALGKRTQPQQIPDGRTPQLDRRYPLNGAHVLEIGCFEGVHTVGLCSFGARVTAVDARIENVVKTIVRSTLFGYKPDVFVCDVERDDDLVRLPQVDVVHHVGVLYHLLDPVAHLQKLAPKIGSCLMLDTHVATNADAVHRYTSGGSSYRYRRLIEGGRAEVFSGIYDHAKWLLPEDIESTLRASGFKRFETVERREERNGLRVLLFASR